MSRLCYVTAMLMTCATYARAQAGSSQTQSVAPPTAEIADAIARGARSKEWEGLEIHSSRMSMFSSGMGFYVKVEGPLNRVANEAGDRARKYMSYSADSVTPTTLAPLLSVTATPRTEVSKVSNGVPVITPPATHIVLAVGEGFATIVQPTKMEFFDVQIPGTADDRKSTPALTTKGVRASFPMSSIPPGPFQVRVITSEREFAMDAEGEERQRVR